MNEALKEAIEYLKNELMLMENKTIEIKKTINMIEALNGTFPPTYQDYEFIEQK